MVLPSQPWIETVHRWAIAHPGSSIGVLLPGPVCGLRICNEVVKRYEGRPLGMARVIGSSKKIQWLNGSQASVFSVDEPEKIRGQRFDVGFYVKSMESVDAIEYLAASSSKFEMI